MLGRLCRDWFWKVEERVHCVALRSISREQKRCLVIEKSSIMGLTSLWWRKVSTIWMYIAIKYNRFPQHIRYHPLLLRSASPHQAWWPGPLECMHVSWHFPTPSNLRRPPTLRRGMHHSDGRYAARPSYFSLQRKLTLSGIVYGWNLGIELFASELFLEWSQ
jgi:hypothetical protein